MGLGRKQDIVPVLTYHSVGMNNDGWVWKHLSEPAGVFARLIERLASAGYRTVTLDQLYAHMAGEDRCPPKSIVLVFDDGYLDNWTIVAPLLERHGMSGVVYVNPEFVDPGRGLRPQRAVGEGPQSEGQPTDIGFMNWDELRAVDEAGVLDVQSHSLTHTWYYTGPAIESCHVPANAGQYPWLAWNARPDRKPFYLAEDQSAFVATGTPIFEHEKSLIARRFFPDPAALERVIISFTEFSSGAPACSGPWLDDYRRHVARVLGSSVFPGRHESDTEREARVREELAQSRRIIEEQLGKTVRYLCWPGGGTDPEAKRLARDVGYRSWTLPSRELPSKRNRPGEDPAEIRRMAALRTNYLFGKKWGRGSEMLTLLDLFAHQNSAIHGVFRKAYKLSVAVGLAGER